MRAKENSQFICENCQHHVLPVSNGSYRNHCPECLYSKHLDVVPGDRASRCGGLMAPVNYRYSGKKGYQLCHRCESCQQEQWNKIAEHTLQADNFIKFMTLK